jgi:hypothetical protein
MVASDQVQSGGTWRLLVGGSLLVAASTPLNLVLQLLCWPLVGDNRQGTLMLIAAAANVAMFLVFCLVAFLVFRGSTLVRRQTLVLVVLMLPLSVWLAPSLVAWQGIDL